MGLERMGRALGTRRAKHAREHAIALRDEGSPHRGRQRQEAACIIGTLESRFRKRQPASNRIRRLRVQCHAYAMRLTVPFGTLEAATRMPQSSFDMLLRRNRELYAASPATPR
jgi:hypothetical protein